MENWNCCRECNHRDNMPSVSLNRCSHTSDLWSVRRVKRAPRKYDLNCMHMATTASISRLVVQYRRCEGLSALLQYATTRSWSFWIWLKTPPSPKLLASVSRMYCPVSVGSGRLSKQLVIRRKRLNNWSPTQTAHLYLSNAPMASRCLRISG